MFKSLTLAGLLSATIAAAGPAWAADLTVLYNFNTTGTMTLNRPESGLTIDATGNLFGTAYYNGTTTSGGVYELARQADGSYAAATTVATFAATGTGPRNPVLDPVTVDAVGNIYGAAGGGARNVGAVYEIAAGTSTVTTLASFSTVGSAGYSTGYNPRGAVAVSADGTIWGTNYSTVLGGGTVFKVAPGAGQATGVASFGVGKVSGVFPSSGLIADAQGNLYGSTGYTTVDGDGSGTLFKVNTGTGAVTTLATLSAGSGSHPYGTLAVDSAGNLFGTTTDGGAAGGGTVFELAAGSSTVTALASFDPSTSGVHGRGVVIDAAGNLFGTTASGTVTGSAINGAVWMLAAGSGQLTTLANLATIGSGSYGGLVADGQGNLYGTTYGGGDNNAGMVFKLSNTGYVAAPAAAVPEPATWAMMIAGFGLAGGALRRRRAQVAFA